MKLGNSKIKVFQLSVGVEQETDSGFWFGEVEWSEQSPSLGATWHMEFSDTALMDIIESQKISNNEELKEFGKFIQFGRQVTLKELKENWMDFEQKLFLCQFY